MFGRDATHNAAISKGNLPTDWQVGEFDKKTDVWNREKSLNIKWVANLGSNTFGDPVVAGGLIWVGTNNSQQDNPPGRRCQRPVLFPRVGWQIAVSLSLAAPAGRAQAGLALFVNGLLAADRRRPHVVHHEPLGDGLLGHWAAPPR